MIAPRPKTPPPDAAAQWIKSAPDAAPTGQPGAQATYAKALTLKLTQARYDALRRRAYETGQSHQEILSAAFDAAAATWLASGGR